MRSESCVSGVEYCDICNNDTGKTGRNDDSIYCTLLHRIYDLDIDDEIGPLCTECYGALIQLGVVGVEL